MKYWLFLFLYLPIILRAHGEDLFSEDDNPYLFHHVHVISGHLNFALEDVVQGAKPIPLMRAYSSGGALEDSERLLRDYHHGWMTQGGWSFQSHTDLFIIPGQTRKGFKIYLAEPNGSVISYAYSHHKGDRFIFFKPTGPFSSLSGNLSAKNNLQNNLLQLDLKAGIALLYLPDGGIREYHGSHFHRRESFDIRDQCFYRLVKEISPSKHPTIYTYDKHGNLIEIKATNPAGTKAYASVHFNVAMYPLRLRITTSDAREFTYTSFLLDQREYLCKMESPHSPLEIAGFVPSRKGYGHRMHSMNIGRREQFRAYYYTPANKDEESDWFRKDKPFFADKVKYVEEPVGTKDEMVKVAHFSYEPHCTEVRDGKSLMTRYRHDGEKLTQIEYYDSSDQLTSIQRFYWDGNRLHCKALFNPQDTPLLAKTFAYDELGNVTEEGLWGDLSGVGAPLVLDGKGNPTGEGCRKWYTYLPHFNVLKSEREEHGLFFRYEYIQDTNLLSAKFTYDGDKVIKREFWGYDSDHLLIYEIVDDGFSEERNDCVRVTQRRRKDYTLESQSGLPKEIKETYWDPESRTDRLLRRVHLTYSPAKQVIAEDIYDADNVYRYTLHTSYDSYGRILRKTTPLGQEILYSYDALGNLASSKELGEEKQFGYDAAGRQTSCKDGKTGTTTFTTYDSKGRTLSQIDAKGNATHHTYDAFGHCIKTEFPRAVDESSCVYTPTLHFTYDLQGNLAGTEMPRGESTKTFYTSYRKPKLLIRPDGSEVRHLYHKNGSLIKTLHPDGSEEHFTYDRFLRMTSKELYSADHVLLRSESWEYNTFSLISHTDPRGLTTTYCYDGVGRLIEERAEERVTTYVCDALGHLERKDNGSTTYVEIHDVCGRVVEHWEETAGRIENWTAFTYNEENLKIQARRHTSQGEARDDFVYDAARRLTKHTDPEGNATQWIHDETHQNDLSQRVLQKTTIDALRTRTIETHDAAGRPISCEKQDRSQHTLAKEAFFYDRSGNRAKRVTMVYDEDHPIRETASYWIHDTMGRVLKSIEAGSKVTQFEYDIKGRLTYKCLPSGIAFDYSYDGADRLLSMKSSDGSVHYQYSYLQGPDPTCIQDCVRQFTLERKYNAFGQIAYEQGAFVLDWTYDAGGRCTSFTLPDGSSIFYTYAGKHLVAVQRESPEHHYTHRYLDFDVNGHVIKEECINHLGTIETMHDLLERPCKQTSTFAEQGVTYGPTGLITTAQSSLFGPKEYAHDALNQLTKENEIAYSFDSLGNPTDCTIGSCNEILKTSDCALSYDPDGNPTHRSEHGESIQYFYDALGRLTEIADSSHRVRYVYDPLSRLLYRESDNGKCFFLYDHDREIGTMDEEGHILELKILGLGLKGDIGAAVALEIDGHLFVPLHDLGGNLIAIVNSKGVVGEAYDMDAFGNAPSPLPPPHTFNPWRFCSKRSMDGLIFFGMRFYDPTLKRWLTPDPSGFADGPNLYLYVRNNPLRRLDLFGLFSEDRFGIPHFYIGVPVEQIPRLPCITSLKSPGSINGTKVDYFISSGQWHKIQFTPEELRAGKLNLLDHLGELLPRQGNQVGLVTVGNGINTFLHQFYEMNEKVQDVVGGTLFISIHNPTEFVERDVWRTMKERWGVNTPTICRTRQLITSIAESVHKVNPDAIWLYLAHSENGVISKRAIEGLSAESKQNLQKHLFMYALGPAEPLPKKMGQSVINVYSNKDYITKWFSAPFIESNNYDIRFVKCESPRSEMILWFADHGFSAPTYQTTWSNYIGHLRNEHGFYQGDSNEQTR